VVVEECQSEETSKISVKTGLRERCKRERIDIRMGMELLRRKPGGEKLQ